MRCPAGWLNLLGQIGLTASVASCLANHIAAMWVLYNGHVFEQEELLLTYAGRGPACPHTRSLSHCERRGRDPYGRSAVSALACGQPGV